jgi:hypothetical protein
VVDTVYGGYDRTQTDPWYTGGSAEKQAEDLWQTAESVRGAQNYRREADRFHMSLFSDLRYVGISAYEDTAGGVGPYDLADMLDGRLVENIIKPLIMTLQAEITENIPATRFVTTGSDHYLQQQADHRTQWVDGVKYASNFDKLVSEALVLQGLTFGTGAIKFLEGDDYPLMEPAFTPELWVDPSEARYGTPRNLYQLKSYDREVARGLWPGHDREIDDAQDTEMDHENWFLSASGPRNSNMITIAEGWHLPSATGANDGYHDVVTSEGSLLKKKERKWIHPWFPFVFWHGELRPRGFWGRGVPEDLAGQQIEVNKTLHARQLALHLFTPGLLLERGSKIVKASLTNIIGRVLEYTGTKPDVFNPPVINAEVFKHSETIVQNMYDSWGVSMLSARAEKPAGLDSGRAIREYADQKSRRLIDAIRRVQYAVLESSNRIADMSREMAKERKDTLSMKTIVSESLQELSWDESIDKNVFEQQVMPVSGLSKSLSGRFADLQDLQSLQIVLGPDENLELLGLPDLKKFRERRLSRLSLCRTIVEERILKDGKNVAVPKHWPLDILQGVAMEALLEQEAKKKPSKYLDKLRQLLADIEFRKNELSQELAAKNAATVPAIAAGGTEPVPPGATVAADPAAGAPVDPALLAEAAGVPADGGVPPEVAGALPVGP